VPTAPITFRFFSPDRMETLVGDILAEGGEFAVEVKAGFFK